MNSKILLLFLLGVILGIPLRADIGALVEQEGSVLYEENRKHDAIETKAEENADQFPEAKADPEEEQEPSPLEKRIIEDYVGGTKELLQKYQEDLEKTNELSENDDHKEVEYPSLDASQGGVGFDAFTGKEPAQESSADSDVLNTCANGHGEPGVIKFIRPSSPDPGVGVVVFGNQACPGVKRIAEGGGYRHSNYPDESLSSGTSVTKDGAGRGSSGNFKNGAYGNPADPSLAPLWLGGVGQVQIHSLSPLVGNSSVAGIASKGCLVVNQDCIKALNAFVDGNANTQFKIEENDALVMELSDCSGATDKGGLN